jgi:16S rRNA C967 or C1407 C5-methylase (RsmB/RsmF family)
MGRGNRRKKNRPLKPREDGADGDAAANKTLNNDNGKDYVKFIVSHGNFRMESYYAAQGLYDYRYNEQGELVACTTDAERDAERLLWRETLGATLPSSFRIANDVPIHIRNHMEAEIDELVRVCQTEAALPVIKKIHFLKGAYQLSFDKATIRKDPNTQKLHQWLKRNTESGFISRQETVSMLPPVVLSPQPSDCLLDTCAAPGSKAAQLLEAMGPSGTLIANDGNWQRAHMLVHQLRRIMHNNPVALITNCNAQHFPSLIQFDRILCDVPCSGDATSRKNVGVWKRWSSLAGLGLMKLQVAIAWKSLAQLAKVGGYVVYSTCSFNPIENEAVVCELLRRGQGKIELVQVELENFKTRPGMTTWKVFCEDKSRREMSNALKKNNSKMQQRRKEWEDKNKTENVGDQAAIEVYDIEEHAETNSFLEKELPDMNASQESLRPASNEKQSNDSVKPPPRLFAPENYQDETLIELVKSADMHYFASEKDVPHVLKRKVGQAAFPPSAEEIDQFHLERCIRCQPQDNDTGGFFVALFRKTGVMSVRDHRSEREQCEPDVKRAKIEEPDNEDADEVAVADDVDLDLGDLDGLDPDNQPIRGVAKKHLVRTPDGENLELGKDDFIPCPELLDQPLVDFYGLNSSFRKDLYFKRASGDAKVLYFISEPIKKLIDLGLQQRLTVCNSGLKGFTRTHKDSEVGYRICQEGVHFLAPFMNDKRKFEVERQDFDVFLQGGGVRDLTAFSQDLQDKLRPLSPGSFVVLLKGYGEKHVEKMMLASWRCRTDKVDGLVSKIELETIRTKLSALENM